MDTNGPASVFQRLTALRYQLDHVTKSWTIEDYFSLLKFYTDILPKLFDVERCTIFINEPETDNICSIVGTGLDGIIIEPPKLDSAVGISISSNESVIKYDLHQQKGFHSKIDGLTGFVTRNLLSVPIKGMTGQRITGAIELLNKKGDGIFAPSDEELLKKIAHFLSTSLESILLTKKIISISQQINSEVERFDQHYFKDIPFIVENHMMRDILDKVNIISKTPVNVFIHGEHGTGKELIARMIHERSDRRDKPFVAVNCASIPENLMESEFFGYEKGAFTGAIANHKGRFEEADGGTLFLDEVADMPLIIQPKFLRAIQEGEGCRLGSNTLRHYNFRIISSSNKELRKETDLGRFRQDLFFRLFSIEIKLPPLRERKEDIAVMAIAFLENVSKRFKKTLAGFEPEVLNLFQRYPWPGNVRQLIREIEHIVALTPEKRKITIERCSPELQSFNDSLTEKNITNNSLPGHVKALEIKMIKKAFREAGGNKIKTANILGITRQGLHKKIKRYKLDLKIED